MKNFCEFLLFVCIFFVCATTAQEKSYSDVKTEIEKHGKASQISVSYERDLTTITAEFALLANNPQLRKTFDEFGAQFSAVYVGPTISGKPFQLNFCLKTRSKTFVFQNNRTFTISVDGKSYGFPEPDRSTTLKKKMASEVLCWGIEEKTLELFYSSTDVECFVGLQQFSLSDEQTETLGFYKTLLTF
ncbi:MAG: hypothetical protein ACK5NT_07130 [Pyrinomonadaceae bacterium]